jgi:hypothetical protein
MPDTSDRDMVDRAVVRAPSKLLSASLRRSRLVPKLGLLAEDRGRYSFG